MTKHCVHEESPYGQKCQLCGLVKLCPICFSDGGCDWCHKKNLELGYRLSWQKSEGQKGDR